MMVKQISEDNHEIMRNVFQEIDKDKGGTIQKQELKQALTKSKHKLSDQEIQDMIESVDYNRNQEINYTEFLAATIDPNILKEESRLKGIFNLFDVDNSGEITIDNMVQTFSKFGRNISKEEINQVLEKHDKSHQGSINFEEFKQMIIDE